jgi:SAM-dependent methyltransferase
MSPRDIGLFVKSARTDGTIGRLHGTLDSQTTFETIYRENEDPWQSASARYRYQGWKYDRIVARLPIGRRFRHALDLGCGLGLLSTRLAPHIDQVLGMDIAQTAVDRATTASAQYTNLTFQQGDVLNLPHSLDGRFDLVVIADTLYYLPEPITAEVLAAVVRRVSELLTPDGVCLLANHYFFSFDPDSKISRRIHDAFAGSAQFQVISETWRPFYLISLLGRATPAS